MFSRIAFTIVISLCAACSGVQSKIPRTTPADTPWRVLQQTCHICLETDTFNCPIPSVRKAVMGCISIAESLENCGADLRDCDKIATVDKAEMQGKVNKQAARADRNAKWIWIVAGIGGVLSVLGLIVGAIAL